MIKLFKKSIPDVSFLETTKTWEELESLQEGYSNKKILENYSEALKDTKIKPDSALIYSSIASIASYAYKNGGKAKIVDFGGGTGNFYYEIKELFPDLDLEWIVIEQEYIVDHFKKAKSEIKYFTLDQYLDESDKKCDILLLSGVLQYIQNNNNIIFKLQCHLTPQEIILDRTFYTYKGDRKLCLQHVNKDISYPAYLFNKEELYENFGRTWNQYKLFNEWQSPVRNLHNSRNKFYYGGAVFKKDEIINNQSNL